MARPSDEVIRGFGSMSICSESPDTLRVVVALDFGTTYSGVAWALSNRMSMDDVEIINTWPQSPGPSSKVPSIIAYADENWESGMQEDQWGFSVRAGAKSYLWTKLLLDTAPLRGKFDDERLRDYFGSGLMALPAGKSAQDVCADYMGHLYQHLCSRLEMKGVRYRIMPMEVWITVPAIWSELAKTNTLKAAQKAGFASRTFLGDSISVITEPEAASLTVLKPKLKSSRIDMMTETKNFLICDCGGGTVDIACYTIKSNSGRPQFHELCVGTGAKCGSTAIDRGFDAWMIRRFGAAYTSVPRQQRGPESKFMRSFESAKRNYRGHNDSMIVEVDPINMPDAPNSSSYDKDQRIVRLTRDEMQSIIDPVIDDVLQLIHQQVSAARKKHKQNIEEILLVGGFGDSEYLNARVKDWCTERNIQLTCPPHCQAAIAIGAVLRGLFKLKPKSRKCRYHYGFQLSEKFRPGKDKEEDSYYDDWDGQKMCRTRVVWVAARGQTIDEATVNSYMVYSPRIRGPKEKLIVDLHCFVSDRDRAPDSTTHWSAQEIGTLRTTFTEEEADSFKSKVRKGKLVTTLKTRVLVNLNADTGLIQFRTVLDGIEREAASTAFEFAKPLDTGAERPSRS